jgi:hypothetical protein
MPSYIQDATQTPQSLLLELGNQAVLSKKKKKKKEEKGVEGNVERNCAIYFDPSYQ